MNNIKTGDFLDFNQLNEYLITHKIPLEDKLKVTHQITGGEFLDENIISKANVSICGIGGFPVVNKNNESLINGGVINKENLQKDIFTMSGISAFMSYFNPSNLELNDLGHKVVYDHRHLSILHTVSVNLFISGISIGVEHEFASQRDILHLSRLTVSKAHAQDNPCLVLSDEKYLPIYKKILNSTKNEIGKNEFEKDVELRNLLFPTAKASAIMITASLRNLLKLIELKNSGGKEKEFVDVLKQIDIVLKNNIL